MASPQRQFDVRGALREGIHLLREADVPSHTLAAELLLMHALGRDRTWLYAHADDAVEAGAAAKYFELVARRATGVPTQYLTGKQEFWGLEFEVTPDVLIPRPETEHVVEVALARLGQTQFLQERRMVRGDGTLTEQKVRIGGDNAQEGLRIVDVGTGSGCIAVALARELPAARVAATDISPAALAVARRNAARHGVAERIEFRECNLLEPFLHAASHAVAARFHLVVSNPPYVGRAEAEVLQREVREHEPATALFAGERGFDLYEPLIAQAVQVLVPRGILVMELGYNAFEHVDALMDSAHDWTRVSVTQDLAGIPRVLAAERL